MSLYAAASSVLSKCLPKIFWRSCYGSWKTKRRRGGIVVLADLISKGFGEAQDLNCAEKILYGANEAYHLGLEKEALKMAAGFGGGMGMENACGALTAAVMVLSKLFVVDRAHESSRIKDLSREFFAAYDEEMGEIDCYYLKKKYRTEKEKCYHVILKSAEILDKIVAREVPAKQG
jgi:C_GCAxxG_C_C family probable redox protein